MIRSQSRLKILISLALALTTLGGCSYLPQWSFPYEGKVEYDPEKAPGLQVMQTPGGTWINYQKDPHAPESAEPYQGKLVTAYSPEREKMEQNLEALTQEIQQLGRHLQDFAPVLEQLHKERQELRSYEDQIVSQYHIYDRMSPSPGQQPGQQQAGPLQDNRSMYKNLNVDVPQGDLHAIQPPPKYSVAEQFDAPPPFKAPPETPYPPHSQQTYGNGVQPVGYQNPSLMRHGNEPPMAAKPGISTFMVEEYSNKVRLVMNAEEDIPFRYNLDNNDNVLIVELQNADWRTDFQRAINYSSLVSSYQVFADGAGGVQLAVQLKRPAQVTWANIVSPVGQKDYKLVLDIAAR